MLRLRLPSLLAAATLAACGAVPPTFQLDELEAALHEHVPLHEEVARQILEHDPGPPEPETATTDSAPAPRPAARAPFRIGIAPPLGPSFRYHGSPLWAGGTRKVGPATFGSWSEEEEAVIAAWTDRFREIGAVSEAVSLPSMLISRGAEDGARPLLASVCAAGRRQQADVVLVVSRISAAQGYPNPLALLDITLVGAFLVPGHEIRGRSVVEAALVDARSGYVYATARGSADGSRTTAGAYSHEVSERVQRETRVAALEELAQDLRRQVHWAQAPGAP